MESTDSLRSNRPRHKCICEECGAIRMLTPSGAVCPHGHGRLHLGVRQSDISRIRHQLWIESLPRATRIARRSPRYKIEIHDGYWALDHRRDNRGLREQTEVPAGNVLASVIIKGRIRVRFFLPWVWKGNQHVKIVTGYQLSMENKKMIKEMEAS